MRCAQCGMDNPAGVSFCQHCGSPFGSIYASAAAPNYASATPANDTVGNSPIPSDQFIPTPPIAPVTTARPRRSVLGCIGVLGCLGVLFSLCAGTIFGTAWLWSQLSGAAPQVTYTGQAGEITALSWSPDGSRVVSTNMDNNQEQGSVQIWNARNGQSIQGYNGLKSLNAVAWSPDGRRIAVAGRLPDDVEQSPAVQIFDAATGGHVLTLRFPNVSALSWSPDSRYLVIATNNGQSGGLASIRDASSGKAILNEGTDQSDTLAVAWSPNGKRIAAGGPGGIVKVWDALTGAHAFTYRGHLSENSGSQPGQIVALAWSPDSQWVASADSNSPSCDCDSPPDYSTVRVWQPFVGGQTHAFPIDARALAWSPDGTRLVTVNEQVRVWDAMSGDHVFSYSGGFNSSTTTQSVAWSPDGTRIAVGRFDGQVQIWQPPSDSSFIGHAYQGDISKVALVALFFGGLCLLFSLRPFVRLNANARTRRALRQTQARGSSLALAQAFQAAQPPAQPPRRFSPRTFLFGLLILAAGAVIVWGMIHYGWDIRNFAAGASSSS